VALAGFARPFGLGSWLLDVECSMFNPLGFSPGLAYLLPRQMALESKPLFHPEVLRQQVRAFNLPKHVGDWQPKLQHWADLTPSRQKLSVGPLGKVEQDGAAMNESEK
jgi:hypothetical protein